MIVLQHRILSAVLRLFFHLLYNQFAWTYDWVAAVVSVGKWQEWILSAIPDLDGRILELGHGPGHLQAALSVRSKFTFGMDLSPYMGSLARRNLIDQGIHPGLVRGRSQSMPFPDQVFDRVVATFPSEFISDPLTLKEAYRVLMPGGRLVVIPFAWITGTRWYERAAAWLFQITAQSPPNLGTPESTALMNSMLQLVREAGFETSFEHRSLPGSLVLTVIAEKPSLSALR